MNGFLALARRYGVRGRGTRRVAGDCEGTRRAHRPTLWRWARRAQSALLRSGARRAIDLCHGELVEPPRS